MLAEKVDRVSALCESVTDKGKTWQHWQTSVRSKREMKMREEDVVLKHITSVFMKMFLLFSSWLAYLNRVWSDRCKLLHAFTFLKTLLSHFSDLLSLKLLAQSENMLVVQPYSNLRFHMTHNCDFVQNGNWQKKNLNYIYRSPAWAMTSH